MEKINWISPEKVGLKKHNELDESFLQDIIAQNPEILGLGDLELIDKERRLTGGGRLDLLLRNPDTLKRYEVEIQLGKTDPSHIIRTIEYWDIERKRYPQYEHCAVIIAEEITGRFLNVISLFNGHIPLIALKMEVWKYHNDYFLTFTKVLDEMSFGLIDDDEVTSQPTDRTYWETHRATPDTLKILDRVFEIIRTIDPAYKLKYNRQYIGLTYHGRVDNLVVLKPRKNFTAMNVRIPKSEEIDYTIEELGIEYRYRNGRYRIKLKKGDPEKYKDFIFELIQKAKQEVES